MRQYFFLFAILSSTLATAQVKPGFHHLENRQFDQARAAFEADRSHKHHAAAAHYGLALVNTVELPGMPECLAAYELMEQAEALAKALKPRKKQKLIKLGWLPRDNFRQIQKTVLDSLTAKLGQTEELAEIDQILDFEAASRSRRFKGNAKTALDRARQRAVAKSLREADDYPTMYSLATRHKQIIVQNNFLFSSNLDWRLINSFIQDYGEAELERFVQENPGHYISRDCWVFQYIEAVKQPTLAGMLDFIHDYPLSFLSQPAFWWLEEHLPNAAARAGLSERQQQQVEMIASSKRLNFQLRFDLPLDSSFHAEALAYIVNTAPSTQAYNFMEKVLQRYLKRQQWDFAEDLAVRCQPWFPDEQPEDCDVFFDYYSEKQPWFNTAIPILQRPAEGITLKPLYGVNTFEGDEYSPVISADGRTLYFAGAGRPDNIKGEDVFVAYWEDGDWSSPVPVENLSGEANFVPLSLTTDGRQMLVFVDGKLHISEKGKEGGWGQPEEIPGISEEIPWIGRAVFADNGRVLILSASKEVGEIDHATDTDLFVAIRNQQGQWEKPFPIGPVINTSGQERSPFLHVDGHSLFFSSNGHDGLGEMDVYKTVRLDNTWKNWSPPINMGKEVNTLEDETGYNYAISASGTSAYLAMTDERNKRYDIHATALPDFAQPKQQTVITLELEQEEEGVVPIIVRDADGKVVGRAISHPDGRVELVVPADAIGPLSITTPSKAQTFMPLSVPIDSSAERIVVEQPVEVFPVSAPCREGRHLKTRGIFFEKSAHDLSLEAQTELQAIYSLLSNCPHPPAIEIAGFADSDGSEASNQMLSQNRAEAARRALVSFGYPAERITAKGYGIKTPTLDRPLTETEKAECRKVEVRIAGQGGE